MNKILGIFMALVGAAAAFGQVAGPATNVIPGPSLPPLCSATAGQVFFLTTGTVGLYACTATNTWTTGGGGGGGGTVTSVSFTGGLVSVASPTTTPALTVAGISGGIPYFSTASTWASSAALTMGQFLLGGGAGSAPTASFSVVPVANGGTGLAAVTSNGIPKGNGASPLVVSGCLIDSSNNLSCPGTVSSGTGSGTAGTVDLTQGTAAGSFPDNSWGFTTPTTITTSWYAEPPNASPSANQVMLFPAPTSNVSQWAWKTVDNANTASAIVARDGSGNFSAGTITAALTGTASGNLVSGGALGTPSSGTASNITGLPEGGLSLTDITTNNSSTSKHGFVPKLPNDATKYYDGTGVFSVPAGGGGGSVSITGTSPVVLTPNPTTGTGVVSLDRAVDFGFTAKQTITISGNQILNLNGAASGDAYLSVGNNGGGGLNIGFNSTSKGFIVSSDQLTLYANAGSYPSVRIFSASGGVEIGGTGSGTDPGATNLSVTGKTSSSGYLSSGTKFTASGCGQNTLVGGATSGTLLLGANVTACTLTITMGGGTTATNGWDCHMQNVTTIADATQQTGGNTTTATFSVISLSGDKVSFSCIGY